jgi:hypothetical protein
VGEVVAWEKPLDAARMEQWGWSKSIVSENGCSTVSFQMLARRIPAGSLVEPALTGAMEGAAIKVMIGVLSGDAS